MSADEYTRTILMALGRHGLGPDVLAAHDVEVARAAKAEALEEAAGAMRAVCYDPGEQLLSVDETRFLTPSDWLDDRAAEYRKVATDE